MYLYCNILYLSLTLSLLHSQTHADEYCFDQDLGCFSTDEPHFHPYYRPISLPPEPPENLGLRFILYTRESPLKGQDLIYGDVLSITNSYLNSSHETKFIIHGFIDNLWFGKWMSKMRTELLTVDNYNVVLVEWKKGNLPPYTQAVANSRMVGALIARMINFLKNTVNVTPESCHLIGHSLGAHIAGYAGKRLKTLGRISGLDPASPLFSNMPPAARLDKTDAKFVDVIHSDARSFNPLRAFHGSGIKEPIGHVDFYPNGGVEHPGCAPMKSIAEYGVIKGFRILFACYHDRVISLYKESINNRICTFNAVKCHSWEQYKLGKCVDCGRDGNQCNQMGYWAKPPPKETNTSQVYYIKTGGPPQYCVHQYSISVRFSRDSGSLKGSLSLKIYGEQEVDLNLNKKAVDFHAGSITTVLATSADIISKPRGAQIKLIQPSGFISMLRDLFSRNQSLKIDEIRIKPLGNTPFEYCFKTEDSIENEKTTSLKLIKCSTWL